MFRWLLAFSLMLALAAPALAQRAELPPAAQDGQCFARVMSPPVTETVQEEVLVAPATTRREIVPATYRYATTRVMVREETIRHRIIPAVYETVTEQVLVRPERVEKVAVPATYETYTETVVVRPARTVWKRGKGLLGRQPGQAVLGRDQTTGELLCLVTEPAVTTTVTRTRQLAPARVEERMIAAEYKTVSRQVVVEPARVVEEVIPAVYEDREIRVLDTPAKEMEIPVPARYETITRQVVVAGGLPTWAEVLCETNTDGLKIAEIQRALAERGYRVEADGRFGPDSEAAMEAFQRANGLASGYLTVETVRALGIDPYGRPGSALRAENTLNAPVQAGVSEPVTRSAETTIAPAAPLDLTAPLRQAAVQDVPAGRTGFAGVRTDVRIAAGPTDLRGPLLLP